jgi:glutaredoxin 3
MIKIITKDNCPWCVKAKTLLEVNGYSYREVNVPISFSIEEFYALVETYQTSKTVPKIFDGDELIGGYEDLADWIDNYSGGFGEGSLA